jgi:hypothetical protein
LTPPWSPPSTARSHRCGMLRLLVFSLSECKACHCCDRGEHGRTGDWVGWRGGVAGGSAKAVRCAHVCVMVCECACVCCVCPCANVGALPQSMSGIVPATMVWSRLEAPSSAAFPARYAHTAVCVVCSDGRLVTVVFGGVVAGERDNSILVLDHGARQGPLPGAVVCCLRCAGQQLGRWRRGDNAASFRHRLNTLRSACSCIPGRRLPWLGTVSRLTYGRLWNHYP